MPGTVLGAQNTAVHKTKNPCSHEAYILMGGEGGTAIHISKLYRGLEGDKCYGKQ